MITLPSVMSATRASSSRQLSDPLVVKIDTVTLYKQKAYGLVVYKLINACAGQVLFLKCEKLMDSCIR